jgi:hypothetical protein
MSDDETQLADKISAVVASDVRVRFQGKVPRRRELRQAILESLGTLISEPALSYSATPATRTYSRLQSCANPELARDASGSNYGRGFGGLDANSRTRSDRIP